MATLTEERDRLPTANSANGPADRGGFLSVRRPSRRLVCLGTAVVVLVWSVVELGSLAVTHTVGPELYGVLVAALAVAAGAADVTLLRSQERRFWISVAVLGLWAVVALGGLAGVAAHIVGPVAGHGPVDTRPRPISAPLVFTLLGVAGGAALFFGQRLHGSPAGRRVPERGKE